MNLQSSQKVKKKNSGKKQLNTSWEIKKISWIYIQWLGKLLIVNCSCDWQVGKEINLFSLISNFLQKAALL